MSNKFDFDAPDCTCPYKDGIVARNMCGHVSPCPVYERWLAIVEKPVKLHNLFGMPLIVSPFVKVESSTWIMGEME